MKLTKFEKEQLKSLKEGNYQDASVHIVLVDLCKDVGVEEVFMMLHSVASDMGKKKTLENMFDKAKTWKWAKY